MAERPGCTSKNIRVKGSFFAFKTSKEFWYESTIFHASLINVLRDFRPRLLAAPVKIKGMIASKINDIHLLLQKNWSISRAACMLVYRQGT